MDNEIVGKSALEICLGILVATVVAIAATGCSSRGYEFKIGFAPVTTQDNRSGFEAPDLKRARAERRGGATDATF